MRQLAKDKYAHIPLMLKATRGCYKKVTSTGGGRQYSVSSSCQCTEKKQTQPNWCNGWAKGPLIIYFETVYKFRSNWQLNNLFIEFFQNWFYISIYMSHTYHTICFLLHSNINEYLIKIIKSRHVMKKNSAYCTVFEQFECNNNILIPPPVSTNTHMLLHFTHVST